MTVFLTADGRPFYGGTYFPPSGTHGMPGFGDLMAAIVDAWTNRRPELLDQAGNLTEALGRSGRLESGDDIVGPEVLEGAYRHFRSIHDDRWGGFGSAPKFPTPQNLDFVVRTLARDHSADTQAMVETSLDAMASGGMYDHLGGGFARYSVDAHWVVPHFEKMLYDQAGLLRLYVHGYQVTGHDRYRQVATETVEYVLRDLRQPGGGIASAEDADSLDASGHSAEGAFYVFTPDEVRAVVAADASVDAELADIGDRVLGTRPPSELRRAVDPGPHPPSRRLGAQRGGRARPPAAVRTSQSPASSRPRRQGAHRVERPLGGRPRRGRRRTGPSGLDRCCGRDRDVPLRPPAPRRRPLAALVAGRCRRQAPRLRRRPCRARRCVHPPGRSHRRGPLDRPRPRHRGRHDRTVLGRRPGWVVHHRRRRRAARDQGQGSAGQRPPVRQLDRVPGAATPGRPRRRRWLPITSGGHPPAHRPAGGRGAIRVRGATGGHRPPPPRRDRGGGDRRTT